MANWQSEGVTVLSVLPAAITAPTDTSTNDLWTVTVPGGAMGLYGFIEVNVVFSCVNNANSKTAKINFGGSLAANISMANALSASAEKRIFNIGSESVQRSAGVTLIRNNGNSGTAGLVGTVDTSADFDIVVNLLKGTGADSVILEAASVVLFK